MPKIEIDYSNTIIYKISCKDPSIKDIYVGHTTNFVQRKHAHKQSCINEKSTNHQCKLYKIIRENGGWNNWNMDIINFFNCKDHYEARIKEQEYFVSLNATLNSVDPMPKPKDKPMLDIKSNENKIIYKCEICNITCNNSNLLEVHNQTKKHIKSLNNISLDSINKNDNICDKPNYKFYCDHCNFNCFKESNYKKHLLTRKHKNLSSPNSNIEKNNSENGFVCECGKEYKHRQSIFSHKKKCNFHDDSPKTDASVATVNPLFTPEIFISLLNQNIELQNHLIELIKEKNSNQSEI